MIGDVLFNSIKYHGKIGYFLLRIKSVTGRIIDELLGTSGELLFEFMRRICQRLKLGTGL